MKKYQFNKKFYKHKDRYFVLLMIIFFVLSLIYTNYDSIIHILITMWLGLILLHSLFKLLIIKVKE